MRNISSFLLILALLMSISLLGDPTAAFGYFIGDQLVECRDIPYAELLFPALEDRGLINVSGNYICKDGECDADFRVLGQLGVWDGLEYREYEIPFKPILPTDGPPRSIVPFSTMIDLAALGINFMGGIGNASFSLGASEEGVVSMGGYYFTMGKPVDFIVPYRVGLSNLSRTLVDLDGN